MKRKIPEGEAGIEKYAEEIEFLIIGGVLFLKRVQVILFIDDLEEEPLDTAHIIKTLYVNGVEKEKEVRIFYCFDREFWIEEPGELVKELYPDAKTVEH